MIRNESEYKEAAQRLEAEEMRLLEYRKKLKAEGLDAPGIKRALDPLRSFHEQLREEVEHYERLKRGDLGNVLNLHGLGQMLVGLRIALGLTQKELAMKLECHESQVSRDERNEYHGVTLERASKILDAMGVRLRSALEELPHERRVEAR